MLLLCSITACTVAFVKITINKQAFTLRLVLKNVFIYNELSSSQFLEKLLFPLFKHFTKPFYLCSG